MPTLNSNQLEFFRRQNQRSKLYLSMFSPSTLGSALIAAHPQGARQLSINTFTGTMADILPGMTALIGTAIGDDSLGRVRIKNLELPFALNIAENSIHFPYGTIVTILKDWAIWPVFPRVEANGDLEIWQDYDIEYSDQNTNQDPIVIMGCGCAKTMPVGGSTSIWFDWSSTYSPSGASIVSYSATFDGGTPNTSTSATPGYVSWNATGSYWVHLTVTDSNGKTFTGRRQVIIQDNIDAPFTAFEVTALTGSWDNGGWQTHIRLYHNIPISQFRDRTYVILWREDFNNGDQRETGRLAGREHILFTGWIDGESVQRLPHSNFIEFDALGTVPFLEKISAFPVTLEHNASPSEWFHLNQPTLNKAVRFYLRWNTTALTLADFYPSADAKLAKYLDFDQENVTSAIRALAEGTIFANFASDQYGRMYVDVNAQMATGTLTYVLDLNDSDWREDGEVFVYSPRLDTSWVELSGVYFNGSGEPEPVISQAPGNVPLYEGNRETIENLVTPDQEGLNQLTGQYLAWKNNQFPEVTLPLAGNWANAFDVIPQETVRISLSGTETRRGFVWSNKQMIVRQVDHKYDYRMGSFLTDLSCEARTVGVPGIAGNYPDIPPTPPPCDDCIPPCVPCTPCDPNYPCTPPPEDTWREKVYISTRSLGVFHTHNFSGPGSHQPTWTAINTGLPDLHIRRMIGDPFDPHHRQWVISGNVGGGSGNAIYMNYWDPSGPEIYEWQLCATASDLADIVALEFPNHLDNYANVFIYDIHADIGREGYIGAVIAGNFGVSQQQLLGQGFFLYSINYGRTWQFGGRINLENQIPSPRIARMEISDCPGSGIVWIPIHVSSGGGLSWIAFNPSGSGDFTMRSIDEPETHWFGASEADIYVDPSFNTVLYTLGGVFNNYRNLYRSDDAGLTWELVFTVDSEDALVNWHSLQPTFTNGLCGAGPSDFIRVIDALNGNLYFSLGYGAVGTWQGPVESTGNFGDSLGISLIHDSKTFLYGIHRSTNVGNNIIAVTIHDHENAPLDPLLWYNKSGNSPTHIPGNCGGVTDILQVWTEEHGTGSFS